MLSGSVRGVLTMSGRSTLLTPPKPDSCVTFSKKNWMITPKASVIIRK
jgi:hypothetical protein